jgi:hypothetical protein
MKRQTLLQTVIFLVLLVFFLGLAFQVRFQASKAMASSSQQVAVLGPLSINVPKAFGPGHAYRDQDWAVQEYRGGSLGTLRLAMEPGDGTPWEALCTRWFGLPAYRAEASRFEAGHDDWFFKEVPLFGRGAYALRKSGKQLRFIALFEHEGNRYWIGLDTRNPSTAQKAVFDGMVQSLRFADGTSPGPGLAESLRPIAREGGYRFIQPVEIIFFLPALLILLITLIQLLIRRRAGRLPEEALQVSGPPVFAEGGLEIGLARPFQRKFMDCAVTVDAEGLTVHTFGTPFLFVPRQNWAGRIDVGNAWLGFPFVNLT